MEFFSNMQVVKAYHRGKKNSMLAFLLRHNPFFVVVVVKLNEETEIQENMLSQEDLLIKLTVGLVGLIESFPQSIHIQILSHKTQTTWYLVHVAFSGENNRWPTMVSLTLEQENGDNLNLEVTF